MPVDPELARESGHLTAREAECLKLLARGCGTDEAARELGISRSTLNGHLASVRRKLGVDRTSKALVIFNEPPRNRTYELREGHHVGSPCVEQRSYGALMRALERARSGDEAWRALCAFGETVGIKHCNYGVVAEPAGDITNAAALLQSSLPAHAIDLYGQVGGVSTDPMVSHIANQNVPRLFHGPDLADHLVAASPPRLTDTIVHVMTVDIADVLVLPRRDEPTGAPYGGVFGLTAEAKDRALRDCRFVSLLDLALSTFWNYNQKHRRHGDRLRLTPRQRDLLRLTSRGFTVAQCAERLGVSTRAAEKLLAGCWASLGARTTAAAVYRAMVYRAI